MQGLGKWGLLLAFPRFAELAGLFCFHLLLSPLLLPTCHQNPSRTEFSQCQLSVGSPGNTVQQMKSKEIFANSNTYLKNISNPYRVSSFLLGSWHRIQWQHGTVWALFSSILLINNTSLYYVFCQSLVPNVLFCIPVPAFCTADPFQLLLPPQRCLQPFNMLCS